MRGYANDSMRRAAWLVGDFSRWLMRRGIVANDLTSGHIDAFLRCRRRRRTPRYEDRPTLSRLLSHLAHNGIVVVAIAIEVQTPAQQLEAEYVAYMRQERSLAPTTIYSNRMQARRLLASLFADGATRFDQVAVQDVIAHVRRATSACRQTRQAT